MLLLQIQSGIYRSMRGGAAWMEFRHETACFDDVLLVPGQIRPTCCLVTAKRSRKPWGRSRISSLPVNPDWASSAASTAFRPRYPRERLCAGAKLSFGPEPCWWRGSWRVRSEPHQVLRGLPHLRRPLYSQLSRFHASPGYSVRVWCRRPRMTALPARPDRL